MTVGVRLESLRDDSSARYVVEKRLAQLMRIDLARVHRLTDELPLVLPVVLSREQAQLLVSELEKEGARASMVERTPGDSPTCGVHPRFLSTDFCKTCRAPLCVFCKGESGGLCAPCHQLKVKKTRHQKLRVAVLLFVLFLVSLLAWKEMRRRSIDWSHPARVAVVLVQSGDGALDSQLVEQFQERRQDVEESLFREAARYDSPSGRPVNFTVLGPVDENSVPPAPPRDDLLSLLKFNLALSRYADDLDEALGLDADTFDVRIYVRAESSDGRFEAAEGLGQQLGKIGVVQAEFSEEGIDLVWFVVCHEFFHTRGATDKYDALGHSLNSEGLYDPKQVRPYPQPGTEIMARGQPLSRGKEDLPG